MPSAKWCRKRAKCATERSRPFCLRRKAHSKLVSLSSFFFFFSLGDDGSGSRRRTKKIVPKKLGQGVLFSVPARPSISPTINAVINSPNFTYLHSHHDLHLSNVAFDLIFLFYFRFFSISSIQLERCISG